MLWLLFSLISRCAVGTLVGFNEGENLRQREDGLVRTEPLAQGALDSLGGGHPVLLGAFTRVNARKRRRMNARVRA